jgi:hypothetical protein
VIFTDLFLDIKYLKRLKKYGKRIAKQAKQTPLFRFEAKRFSLPWRFEPKMNGAPSVHPPRLPGHYEPM